MSRVVQKNRNGVPVRSGAFQSHSNVDDDDYDDADDRFLSMSSILIVYYGSKPLFWKVFKGCFRELHANIFVAW